MRFARLVMFAWVCLTAPVLADDCLNFALTGGSPGLEEYAQNVTDVLTQGGVCATATPLPSERATRMMQTGLIDGELVRVKAYGQIIGNFGVMVPTPLAEVGGFLITRHGEISSLEDIRDRGVKVGVLRGWFWMRDYVESVYGVRTDIVNTEESLFEMFRRRRLDAIVVLEPSLHKFKILGDHDVQKIANVSGYIWLHKKHASLVDKVDSILASHIKEYGPFARSSVQ